MKDEMSEVQIEAYKLYCLGATLDNGYKHMSYELIAKELEQKGYAKFNKTTIKRWADRYNFQDKLKMQIATAITPADQYSAEQHAISVEVEKKAVDITRNNFLTADCYDLLEEYVAQVRAFFEKEGYITQEQIKIIKDIASFTGGREDKLLDRLADLGGDKLSPKEVLEQLTTIDVEIE